MGRKWRERICFWFRPQLEKKLFYLLKALGKDTDVTPETVLYGFVSQYENTDGILFKPAVDAVFYKHVGFFAAEDTADAEDYLSSTGEVKEFVKTDIKLHLYVKKLAKRLNEAGIRDICPDDLAAWQEDWYRFQQLGKKICYFMAGRYALKSCEMYEYGFPRFERYVIEDVLRALGVTWQRENSFPRVQNMAGLMAYYLSLTV